MNKEVVSSEQERLILVDEDDSIIGSDTKAACHDGQGKLHRAFSIFLFDRSNRLLVQQRHATKRLWPLYWANSCCSHPRWGEDMETATSRRLLEELGVSSQLVFAYRFQYHASFGKWGSEFELCSVYLGRVSAEELDPNDTEIAATRWLSLEEVDQWLGSSDADQTLAPWFRREWAQFQGDAAGTLQHFLAA